MYEYDAANDQKLQRYYAETQRLEALAGFVRHANVEHDTGRPKLLVDPYAAVDEALDAIRIIATRSKLELNSDE